MSGGHFDYVQYRITEGLLEFGSDKEVKKRFPTLSKKLRHLSLFLVEILHDIDWDLSGDSSIEDDKEFEKESLKQLGEIDVKESRLKTK